MSDQSIEARVNELEKRADRYSLWLKTVLVIGGALGVSALALFQQYVQVKQQADDLEVQLPAKADKALLAEAPKVMNGQLEHFIRDDQDVFLFGKTSGLYVTMDNGRGPLYNGLHARGTDQAFQIHR